MGSSGVAPSPDKILLILDDLCVTLGFCLPATERERISQIDGLDVPGMAHEVLEAEGFNPEYEQKWLARLETQISKQWP